MELFGIKFVPFNEPLERRLQTLAAAMWMSLFFFCGPAGCIITVLLIVYTSVVRWFVILYLVGIYLFDWDTSEQGGRGERWTRWPRNWVWWRYFCSYFPIKLVKTAELDPSRNYLLCCFPHGVMSAGVFGAFGTSALGVQTVYPGLRFTVLTLMQNFKLPFFREFLYFLGGCSASQKSIKYMLSTPEGGRAVVLIVGGAQECLYCDSNNYRILLHKRTGFVRIALEHGTPLVPVICFGENDLYNLVNVSTNPFVRSFQDKFRKVTGYSPFIPNGRGFFQYSFGLIPHRRPVTVVVGAPLELPIISNPTSKDILKYRGQFEDALKFLFDTHKYKYLENPESVNLIME